MQRLEADAKGIEFTCSEEEQHYFTFTRLKFNYKKHFREDEAANNFELEHPVSQWTDKDIDLPYKTRQCAKKYAMRDESLKISAEDFVEGGKNKEYYGLDIWDLNYISTSDIEDNDKESDKDKESSESEKSADEKKETNGEEILEVEFVQG